MFSQTVEYALRAIMCLAESPGESRVCLQISGATKVPPGYLSKVLRSLARAGLVRAQRGLHGGFTLARPADQITILDVVNAISPVERIRRCPLGIAEHATLCPLHRRLDDAMATVERSLGSATLADVLTEPGEGGPLCTPGTVVGLRIIRRHGGADHEEHST